MFTVVVTVCVFFRDIQSNQHKLFFIFLKFASIDSWKEHIPKVLCHPYANKLRTRTRNVPQTESQKT